MFSSVDLDFELLLSNSSDTNGTCGGERLESGLQVALGVFLAVGAFVAYLPQVRAFIDHLSVVDAAMCCCNHINAAPL